MSGFLAAPPPPAEPDPDRERLFAEDVEELGYVMNASRLWAYQPSLFFGLFDLLRDSGVAREFPLRQRAVLVSACASAYGDSYCSLMWGSRLAKAAGAPTAAAVLRGTDEGLTAPERALAGWVRRVVRGPSRTTAADVQELRDAGFTDRQVFAVTVFVALRLAFSTVNAALGVVPDAALRTSVAPEILAAVDYGRPLPESPSV